MFGQSGVFRAFTELINQPPYIVVPVLGFIVATIIILVSSSDISAPMWKIEGDPNEWQRKALTIVSIIIIVLSVAAGFVMYFYDTPDGGDGPDFQVEKVTLFHNYIVKGQSTPMEGSSNIEGPCPINVSIKAEISVTDTGEEITYQWIRDSQRLERKQLTFEESSIKSVRYNETFGESDAYESHSYRLRIITPDSYRSNETQVNVMCQ